MNITSSDLVSGTKSSESPLSGRTSHSDSQTESERSTSPKNQQQEPTSQTIPSAKFSNDDLDLIGDDYMKLREKLDEYKCPICMEILVKTSMISCGHRFCLYCIKQWFHHSFPRRFCPVCRKNCIYYQDDVDTDVSISNIYRRLPPPEQEERNMILLDREYLTTLPLSRMPEQNVYFDGFVDELSQSWANQYYTDFITSPFEFEPMNPIMTETYYPPFHHYGSYEEVPFSGYQERPNGPTSPQLLPPLQSTVDPPHSTSVDAMCFHPAANNYLSPPPPPPQMTNTSVAGSALGLNFSRGPGDYLPQPSGPGGNIGSFGYMNEDYHAPDGAPQQPLAGNLELPMDPNLPLWNPQNYDGPSRTLPYDSMNHLPTHLMDTYNHYTDVRSNIQPFRLPEATNNMNWNGGQDPNEWHLMSGPQDNWTFPGNSLHNPSPVDSPFKSVIPTAKSIKKLFCSHNNNNNNNNNNTTTHEDYQQDVLIQEEFQRLDEMLLRDDDLSLSDVDQVSVESVVSSEQQYDSPWEAITEHRQPIKSDHNNNNVATVLDNEPEKSPAIKTAEGSEHSTVNTASTRVAAVVEESRQNSQQVIMHSSQQEQQRRPGAPQQTTMLSHIVGKTTAVRTYTATTTIQSVETLKKPFRLKTATTTIEIPQQQHFQPQSPQQPRRLTETVSSTPTPQPTRILEHKRTIGRIRMDQARVTDRPAVQNFKPYQPLESIMMATTSQPAPLPMDFRAGGAPVTTRRTTPRLPRIRMDARRLPQSPQPTQVLKRKPLSMSPPGSSGTESSPSSPGRNMMGISQGDGVWGPVPEMNARMYLPHGVLLFKMEYQPHGTTSTTFSPRKNEQETSQQAQGQSQQQQQQQQQQQSSQQSRSQVLTNLAKFTHPVIHMLPLSADGSTRLNVTFDVIYQN